MFTRLNADGTIAAASPTVDRSPGVTTRYANNPGQYGVGFTQPVDSCVPVATPAAGVGVVHPTITVYFIRTNLIGVVIVDGSGQPVDDAFNLIVAC